MFVKPFRVKSSVQLKTSEKKKFRHLVESCFSNNPEIIAVLPNKGAVLLTKLLPHDAGLGMVQVHSIDKVPLFVTLESDNVPIPTVHTLWKIPNLLPCVTMPYMVLDKLLGGADLMLPGIHTESLPDYWDTGDVVAVCSPGNGAALAVGVWAVSRTEAQANGMRGKGIYIYQIYQDQIWHFGTKDRLPTLPPLMYKSTQMESESMVDSLEPDTIASTLEQTEQTPAEQEQTEKGITEDETNEECGELNNLGQAMEDVAIRSKDDILLEACYRAIRTSFKQHDLPMLISTFYSQHVKHCSSEQLEIKQTRFKKVGVLMKELEKYGLLVVKESKKGVFHITEVNFSHEALRSVRRLQKQEEVEEEEEEENIAVVQAFTCNAHVLPLFSKYRCKKGDIMLRKAMREHITEYIRSNNLTNEANKQLVILDPLLSSLMRTRDTTAPWNQIMQKVEANCGKCHVISLPDKFPITVKGDLPPIQFKVEKRTGNKKVTIVSNFEIFGIEAKELAQKLQHVMSSSASVVPGLKTGENNVLVQGDARRLASKLLLDYYRIPKSFVAAA